jgi:hypothetical protein
MCVGDDESPLGNAFIASETLIVEPRCALGREGPNFSLMILWIEQIQEFQLKWVLISFPGNAAA